jgi:hypothetical protein
MVWGAEYVGSLLLVLGVALMLARRKRRFDRTNQFGVEQFPSYWKKLGTDFKDGLQRYAALLLVFGGVLILAFRYEDSWGWIVTIPVYAYMLFLVLGS